MAVRAGYAPATFRSTEERQGYSPGRLFSDLPPPEWTQGPELHRHSMLMRRAGALALPALWK